MGINLRNHFVALALTCILESIQGQSLKSTKINWPNQKQSSSIVMVGIKSGITRSTLTSAKFDYVSGLAFGISADFVPAKHMGFSFGFQYVEKGGQLSYPNSNISNYNMVGTRLTYLDLPMKVYMISKPSLSRSRFYGGLGINNSFFKSNGDINTSLVPTSFNQGLVTFRKYEIAAMASAGLYVRISKLPIWINAETNLNQGLLPSLENNAEKSITNRWISFLAGISYGLQ